MSVGMGDLPKKDVKEVKEEEKTKEHTVRRNKKKKRHIHAEREN